MPVRCFRRPNPARPERASPSTRSASAATASAAAPTRRRSPVRTPRRATGWCSSTVGSRSLRSPTAPRTRSWRGERSFDDPGLKAIGISDDTLAYHAGIWRNGNIPPLGFLRVPLDQINYRIPPGTPTTGAARNLAFNKRLLGYSSNHTGGANLVFGDGSVRFVGDSLPLITLQQLVTRSNGEVISND